MMEANILSLEDAALEQFTTARREGTLALSPEIESMLDSMGVWWDEIEQEYFSMSQVYSDSVAELIDNNKFLEN
tara:strand:+ start:3748 stop:3969 length:222 start_codon:yes stop_codon:yes gene_type:complete